MIVHARRGVERVSAMQATFREIGASDEIVKALLGMGIGRPSHIQAAAYRALSADSGYVVLADHAGVSHKACNKTAWRPGSLGA